MTLAFLVATLEATTAVTASVSVQQASTSSATAIVEASSASFLAGATGLVAAPVALVVGRAWGTIPSDFALAALPSLALLTFGPPLASTVVADLVEPGIRKWPVFATATVANLGVLVGSVALGASVSRPADVVVFSIADGLVILGATYLAIALFGGEEVKTEEPLSGPLDEDEP
ncbi:MAG: hypothetical protein HYV07_06450 [Deltaproteobacteria bacterium]|nr:hypothetical protein [Deltaproteobacteria bacterium]